MVLRKGSRGNEVKELQEFLGIGADGVFGPGTEAAVKVWQKENGLVDDGIVIAENIYRHYEKGKSPKQAAIDGAIEVLPAIVSAIITTIIAFSTLLLLDGDVGNYFGEVAMIVILTLLVSLFFMRFSCKNISFFKASISLFTF